MKLKVTQKKYKRAERFIFNLTSSKTTVMFISFLIYMISGKRSGETPDYKRLQPPI